MKFIAPIAALLMTMMLSISCDGGLVGMGGGRQPEDKRVQAIESNLGRESGFEMFESESPPFPCPPHENIKKRGLIITS